MFKNLLKRIKVQKQRPINKYGDGEREPLKAKNITNNMETKIDTVLRSVEPLDIKEKNKNLLNKPEERRWEAKTIPDLNVGDIIDDTYKIAKKFTGGMGFVYVTEPTSQGIRFAIKQPNKQMLSNKSFFARIISEADEWTNLGMHPNIAYCYFVKAIENIPYIFIEYVESGNLREWIADGKCIEIRASLDMCIQFCHGMEHAHNKGMKHRDIKPENVLMTKEGKVKITDFGLAGKLEKFTSQNVLQDEELTQVGDIMGTKAYMSPEQWKDPHNVDERADLFSFGVCMWEMLCGCRPYMASIGEISPPPDIMKLRDDLPGNLIELLYQVIALDKEERPRNFTELRDQLNLIYKTIYDQESPFYRIELADTLADELNNKGFSYYQLGNSDKAIESWKEALKIDPLHFEANYNYGYQLWNMGELSGYDFINIFENCTENTKQRNDYWTALAWLHYEQGNYEAINAIQESEHKAHDKNFLNALNDTDRPLVRFIRTFKGHTEYINFLTFSPDGNYMLTAGQDKTVRLWDFNTGKVIRMFLGHKSHVKNVHISPESKYVLACDSNFLKKWDIETGEELAHLEFKIDQNFKKNNFLGIGLISVESAISPDCRYALSGGDDKIVRLWDIESGREMMQYTEHINKISSVNFSPDSKYALTGCYHGHALHLWDISTGRLHKVFNNYYGGPAVISQDSKFIFAGGQGQSVNMWDVSTGEAIRSFKGINGAFGTISLTPDMEYALTVDYNTARIWEISSGKEIRRINKNNDFGRSGAFNPNGRSFIFGNNKELSLWEMNFPKRDWGKYHSQTLLSSPQEVSKKIKEFNEAKKILKEAKLEFEQKLYNKSYKSLELVRTILGYERNSKIIDLQFDCAINGGFLRHGIKSAWGEKIFYGHENRVSSLAILPNGKHLLSGSEDKTIRLWDISSGKEIMKYIGHTSAINAISVSPGGNYAASACSDSLILWNIEKGAEEKRFKKITGHINSLAFSQNGKYLFTTDLNNGILKWNISNGLIVWKNDANIKSYPTTKFSPNGNKAVSIVGGKDGTINIWNLMNGFLIKGFRENIYNIYSAVFSKNGKFVLFSGDSYFLWDVDKNRMINKIDNPIGRIYDLSEDYQYVLSSGAENTFKLWDVCSGKELFTFYGHTSSISSLLLTLDSKYAISASNDHTIRLWRLDWNWVPPPPKKDFDRIKNRSFPFLNLKKYLLQKLFQ